jgi:hypothetical protein
MRRLALSAVLVLIVLTSAVAARGELIQQGNLRVHFDGKLRPCRANTALRSASA